METSRRQISLGFTDQKIPEGRHLVYVYNDDVERKRVISKFIESGFMEREKVLCLVDTISPEEMKNEMKELGVDIECEGCALKIAEDLYAPKGYFSSQDMLDVLTVHPFMVIKGQIVKNSFFIEPEKFLLSFRERLNG